MKLLDFKEELYEKLRDPEYAGAYLQDAYEDSTEEFLYALREIAIARGGIDALSKKIERGRCSLYKSLSQGGNPLFETVSDVLRGVGFRLRFDLIESESQESIPLATAEP